jgi:hypothetical protein
MRKNEFAPGLALALGLCLVQAPALPAAPVEAATPGELEWHRLASGCLLPEEDLVACGPSRAYAFGEVDLGPECRIEYSGSEVPRLYPEHGPLPEAQGGVPCAGGGCLSAIPPAGPWIAAIDWRDNHGLSVAETLRRVSGLPVHLFALDAPDALERLGDQVGDAHVLLQLCALAEQAEHSPPQAVNLSFGRFAAAQAVSRPTLDGEIRGLVAELAERTRLVAAAGNDALLLFPAAIPQVLAVGALDLASFRRGQVVPSSISPQADAYFPAYGLLLENNLDGAWPAPPGTSYASALAAGWIAELVLRQPAAGDAIYKSGQVLYPAHKTGAYRLQLGGQDLAGSANPAGGRLVAIAAGPDPQVWRKLDRQEGQQRDAAVTGTVPAPGYPTWTEVRGRANNPAPDSFPCVPCANAPDPWGVELEPNDLAIELGAGESFAPGLGLVELYLQSGERTLGLDLPYPTTLDEIEIGRVETLIVQNLPPDFREHELLIVWVLQEPRPGAPRFIHKTPISLVDWPQGAPPAGI